MPSIIYQKKFRFININIRRWEKVSSYSFGNSPDSVVTTEIAFFIYGIKIPTFRQTLMIPHRRPCPLWGVDSVGWGDIEGSGRKGEGIGIDV